MAARLLMAVGRATTRASWRRSRPDRDTPVRGGRSPASKRQRFCGHFVVGPVLIGLLAGGAPAIAAAGETPWSGLGRAATPDEIEAWDIDVRADFRGLPAGSGSVEDGAVIWEEQCESCHGVFGESSQVFTPLVGGTTAQDMRTGRVANLTAGGYPFRSSLMKLSKLSTLWDYINRAMPWNAPKSLAPDEVYAVTAYLLYLGEVVPEDFVLSNETIREVQQLLPNRNGLTTFEPLWSVTGKTDVQGDACMTDCATGVEVQSQLPDYARDAHGNLAEQHRLVGPTRGAVTTQPVTRSLQETRRLALALTLPSDPNGSGVAVANPSGGDEPAADDGAPRALLAASNCLACHAIREKRAGPAFRDIARHYPNDGRSVELLAGRVRGGTQGVWGAVPMPANPGVSEADARRLVQWILGLARD